MPTLLERGHARGLVVAAERGLIGRSAELFAEEFADGYVLGVEGESKRLNTVFTELAKQSEDHGMIGLKIATDAPDLSAQTIIDLVTMHAAKPASATATIGSRATQNVAVLLGPGLTDRDGDAWSAIAASVNLQFGIAPTKQ